MSNGTFQLPDPSAGPQGLQELVDAVGTQNFQRFIRWSRDKTDATITDFVSMLAAGEVIDVMTNNPDMSYITARHQIARRWGYIGTSLTNFYRYADRGYQLITGNPPQEKS